MSACALFLLLVVVILIYCIFPKKYETAVRTCATELGLEEELVYAIIKAESGLAAQNLDVGFRVLKLADSNMKDVYYHPEEYTQQAIGGMVSNIKEDRTDLDLLYACLLDWGVEIHLPHTSTEVAGCTVHNVDNGALMACFHANVPAQVVEYMAAQQPLRAVFRDSAFASDDAKINVTEIFKNRSPDTQVKVI